MKNEKRKSRSLRRARKQAIGPGDIAWLPGPLRPGSHGQPSISSPDPANGNRHQRRGPTPNKTKLRGQYFAARGHPHLRYRTNTAL